VIDAVDDQGSISIVSIATSFSASITPTASFQFRTDYWSHLAGGIRALASAARGGERKN
jgi:hypothetical protein